MRSWRRAIVRGLAIQVSAGRARPAAGSAPDLVAQRALLLDHAEGFEHVAELVVLEVAHGQAAVEALAHFLGVVLLAPQRGERALVDRLAAALHVHLAVAEDR